MNTPKNLARAAVGALALNAAALNTSCDPGECHIVRNSQDSNALYEPNDVRSSCNRTHDQVIDCFVVSDDGDIRHESSDCGPDLNGVLDRTFNPCIEKSKGNTCVCYDGDGATARCND